MRIKNQIFFLLFIIFLSGCNKIENIEYSNDEHESVLQFIKKLGYHDHEIRDIGDAYLVDGDILFAKNGKPNFSIFGDGPKTKHYGTTNYVGYHIQPNIKVRI